MMKASSVLFIVGLALAGPDKGIAVAQNYPAKPVRIVTSEAGGGADLITRLAAQGLAPALGQQVIVENRPSALTGEFVANAAPDGYTLLINGSSIWISSLFRKTAYDPVQDLAPITLVSRTPNIVVVHPSLPVKSIRELIALAKARPGELNYASAGPGGAPHLSAELFKSMAGINVVGVTYRGNGPSVNALISGEVHMMISTAGSVASQLGSRRLNALAVTSSQPSILFPGLPTVAAAGLPGYETEATYGAFAPARTPPAIVSRLNRDLTRYLVSAEARERFVKAGLESAANTPEQLASLVGSDLQKLGKVIRDAGLRVE